MNLLPTLDPWAGICQDHRGAGRPVEPKRWNWLPRAVAEGLYPRRYAWVALAGAVSDIRVNNRDSGIRANGSPFIR